MANVAEVVMNDKHFATTSPSLKAIDLDTILSPKGRLPYLLLLIWLLANYSREDWRD